MSIEVVTPATNQLLTTLDSVKRTLNFGISDTDQDDLLEDLILSISQMVTTITGRVFGKETVKESLTGDSLPNLVLDRTPIISVSEVLFDNTEITDYEIFDRNAGILQRESGWTSTNLPWNTITPYPSSYAKKRWHVTYIGGYNLPSEGDRNFPYDLERAVLESIKTLYLNKDIDTSIKSYKIGESQVSWERKNNEGSNPLLNYFPPMASGVINYYTRKF